VSPIMLAGLFGLAKGIVYGRSLPAEADTSPTFGDVLAAPVREELLFRGALQALPPVLSAAAFGAAHVVAPHPQPVLRFADAAFGGLLYSQAAKSSGFAGAVLAHMLHNLAVSVGASAAKPRR